MAGRKKKLPPLEVVPAKPSGVVVITKGGLLHKSNLTRLKEGVKTVPSVSMLVEDETSLWGGGRWTSHELRCVLVEMVAEGQGPRDALESLRGSCPPVPSFLTIHKWRQAHSDFDQSLKAAQRLRGEMQAEAATELTMESLMDEASDPRKVKNAVEQLRWSAAKLDRETYGEHKQLDITQPMAAMSDEDIDRRIKMLMADPKVRGVLSEGGFNVVDAEVVEDPE